jgi:asparagine synthetase B (glutamine-hydrolysing)
MCGIVGIAGGNPHLQDLEAMVARVRHRGPDGEGVHLGTAWCTTAICTTTRS